MAEPITTYKLMILALLDKSASPLTNTQLADFFLGKEYTTYFTVQEAINELDISGFVQKESTHNNTQYALTPAGEESLHYFSDKLSSGILEDIKNYLLENQMDIQFENSIYADYYKTLNQQYAVRCRLKEKDISRLDLTITVPSREIAEAICQNWKSQNEDVYDYLMDLLVQ